MEEKNLLQIALELRKEGSITESLHILKLAVEEQNDPMAMFHLGFAYRYRGWGIKEKDKEKALELFERSAQLGNPYSMAMYALCLKRNNSTGKKEWANKAIESGNKFAIGLCRFHSLTQDVVTYEDIGIECFKDCDDNDEYGQYMLGTVYNLRKKHNEAIKHLTKAATQGLSCAFYELASAYESVGKFDEANKMYVKATLQGTTAIAAILMDLHSK